MRYWIWWNDLTQGPFELDELVTLKAFSEDLLVCMEDREDWIPAGRVADLSSAIEQLRERKATPLTPPPPPPKRPPSLTPLQGEFFTEGQGQETLLEPDEGPKGPYAYRPVSIESESVSYLIGQVTMPFHFVRQPMSPVGGTAVIEMPVAPPSRVTFAPQPVIRESPIPQQEEEPSRVPLRLLKEESSIDWSEPAPSQAPSLEEPPTSVHKLEWIPWILGVLASLLILGTAGYWMMDRASTRSAIAEANRLESPKHLSIPGSMAQALPITPAASAAHQSSAAYPKSFFSRAISALLHRLGFSPPAAQSGSSVGTVPIAEPSSIATPVNEAPSEVSRQGSESRSSENPSTTVGKGSESFATRTLAKVLAPAGFVPVSSVASVGSSTGEGASSQHTNGIKSVVTQVLTAILARIGFVPVPSAAPVVSSVSGVLDAAVSSAATGGVSSAGSATSHVPSASGQSVNGYSHSARHPHATSSAVHATPGKGNKTSIKRKPNAHHDEASHEQSHTPQAPLSSKTVALIAKGDEAAAQSALTGQPSANSAAKTSRAAVAASAAPVAPAVPAVPSKALPGLGAAHSPEEADPKAVPVQDAPVPPAPESTDPWKGKQSIAIGLVTNKTLPKSKITVGSQAKSMLQEMHEKELIHAAETGVRLYLPDKIAWAALQEDGPHYRVYLNFMASQANGERVQTRSYQFLVDIQRHEVRPADPVTQQDLLSQPAELTFKHNPMATDIDSILGGVDTFNKHKVQLIIVKKSKSNREERSKMENAMNLAQAKIKRGVVYFRRTYPETALQNIAKAYNFTELLN